jgi:hypothetical protein
MWGLVRLVACACLVARMSKSDVKGCPPMSAFDDLSLLDVGAQLPRPRAAEQAPIAARIPGARDPLRTEAAHHGGCHAKRPDAGALEKQNPALTTLEERLKTAPRRTFASCNSSPTHAAV